MMVKFPQSIVDFGNAFTAMQKKRSLADYDPFFKVKKSEVAKDIAVAEAAIISFENADVKDRRAFCAYVLIKDRKH
ncbi:hypothetical protein [Roseomonas mucosa]|uniref:hypothetical protein n=1 Tax=Roseomonas mucosa TaxID=207340 RepID=UPI0028CEF853|nr:hypothetical protein [Roseomonas mucosa]MDT8276686.1 hypothetical protein [Roseomonas mucosa]MDT8355266.1 hypothetical protein [Roseomonas mucosa]